MKFNSLFLATCLGCMPIMNGHAQEANPSQTDYCYLVTNTDTVKVAYNEFATLSVDCNQDFKIQSNAAWITTQQVSKKSVIIFCAANTSSALRSGTVTFNTTAGKKIKEVVVLQSAMATDQLIPENKGIVSPVMGWESQHGSPVSEEFVLQQTAALKKLGLESAGYRYVILDPTTFSGRNAEQQLITSTSQFPNGLINLFDRLRNEAFKMGVQTNAGKDLDGNAGLGLGMMGNEQSDCNYFFKTLGCDFIQVDQSPVNKSQIENISDCLTKTGKENIYATFNTGVYPGTWINTLANSWRTANTSSADWAAVQSAIQKNRYLSAYAGNGHYHDMDVLRLNHQLNAEEEQTYIGLWCMLNSPLVVNGDLTKINARTLTLLKNKELISLNQNATFQQAYISQHTNGCYVWVKDVHQQKKGCRAIAVYNSTDQAQEIIVSMDNIDLAGNVSVHDVLTHKDLGNITSNLSVNLPAHGTRIYVLEADTRLERRVYEAETGYIEAYQEMTGENAPSTAFYEEDIHCSGSAKVSGLGNNSANSLEWKQVESQEGGLYQVTLDYMGDKAGSMKVAINNATVKTVEFDSKNGNAISTLNFTVELQKGYNSIKLSNATAAMPAIDVMKLHPCNSASLFVEAENFNLKGGWKVDQQFMDLMGSPYLNAHGMGVPVEDAVTEIEIPANSTYHVYVRTYNWTSPWTSKEGPGKFQLGIDGKKMEKVLGATGNKWEWQYAGNVTLSEGKHALALHDLTGFNGRVDAIYFNSVEMAPPSGVQELGDFRRTQLNLPNTPEFQKDFDLVVCGGGIAGMCAAMAAARQGMKVALINDRPVLGGNNSAEVRVHLGGRIEVPPYPNLGNLIKEFGHTKVGNAMPEANYEDGRKMQWIRDEKNISLFLNNRVNQVHMDDNQIDYVISQNTETGVRTLYRAPLFIDCTGDGTVGALAGAEFRMGREAKSEFNESKGPATPDSMTMGTSDQWYAVETGTNSPFPLFEYGVVFNESNKEAISKGDWNWENGMHQNQITEFERIRDYGLMVVYSNWSFLKNRYSQKSAFAKKKLEWVAYIGGKRESRRLMGDYILSGNDIVNHKVQPDFTAGTSWTIDLHYPIEKNEQAFNGEAFKSWADHLKVYSYPVPYRCLYSRNVNNLFMAGRNISVTHMALGTTRVMRTTGMLGEVVGLAASVCKKYNALPREVYESHFGDLKVLMEKGAGKQGLPNNQKFNTGSWLNE